MITRNKISSRTIKCSISTWTRYYYECNKETGEWETTGGESFTTTSCSSSGSGPSGPGHPGGPVSPIGPGWPGGFDSSIFEKIKCSQEGKLNEGKEGEGSGNPGDKDCEGLTAVLDCLAFGIDVVFPGTLIVKASVLAITMASTALSTDPVGMTLGVASMGVSATEIAGDILLPPKKGSPWKKFNSIFGGISCLRSAYQWGTCFFGKTKLRTRGGELINQKEFFEYLDVLDEFSELYAEYY